ncbi:MAG: type II toxin-antitoxin system Phd/YefM family antitoxin [bacterium]|nr:type II toxin-antitoxin system Phd/YefM family antitoxin [bacterium]
MIITHNGRPVALLAAVDERNLEQALATWRKVRASQAIVDIQRESARSGADKLSKAEIEAEIANARRARRKTPR